MALKPKRKKEKEIDTRHRKREGLFTGIAAVKQLTKQPEQQPTTMVVVIVSSQNWICPDQSWELYLLSKLSGYMVAPSVQISVLLLEIFGWLGVDAPESSKPLSSLVDFYVH